MDIAGNSRTIVDIVRGRTLLLASASFSGTMLLLTKWRRSSGVEQCSHKAWVGGSNPPAATIGTPHPGRKWSRSVRWRGSTGAIEGRVRARSLALPFAC